jgi:PadR family transcriptional regulator, regulatory protein PadR
MQMTVPTLKVLAVLVADPLGEHYGLELCRAAGLPGGTIYPILARLEQAGWLDSAWEDIDEHEAGRRRRRYYKLTDEGAQRARHALQDAARMLQPVWAWP